jgi:GNAT superfamily N-acetyltransferase
MCEMARICQVGIILAEIGRYRREEKDPDYFARSIVFLLQSLFGTDLGCTFMTNHLEPICPDLDYRIHMGYELGYWGEYGSSVDLPREIWDKYEALARACDDFFIGCQSMSQADIAAMATIHYLATVRGLDHEQRRQTCESRGMTSLQFIRASRLLDELPNRPYVRNLFKADTRKEPIEVVIRETNPSDCDGLRKLLRQSDGEHHVRQSGLFRHPNEFCYPDSTLIQSMLDKNCLILVAEDDDTIAGFVKVEIRDHTNPIYAQSAYGYICDVVVDEAKRGHGIGTRLLEAAKAWAGKKGLKHLELDVFIGNPAKNLYDRLGFDQVSCHMILDLTDPFATQ